MMGAHNTTKTLTKPTVMNAELREMLQDMSRAERRELIQKLKSKVLELEQYDFISYYEEFHPEHRQLMFEELCPPSTWN